MKSLSRPPKIGLAAMMGMLLSSCGGEEPRVAAKSGLDCFPAEAARWIYVNEDSSTPSRRDTAARVNATLYFDRSASMAGYVAGATSAERPYQDLIATLPHTLSEIGGQASFRTFGVEVSDPIDEVSALSQANYYVCRGKGQAGCESHLDGVFKRIAEQSNELAIVVSDLWFDNSEVQSSGLTVLQPLLASILEGGRAVGIYGIDAPFAGHIYDLPASRAKIPYRGRHPLFMIVVGSKQQLLDFDAQLARSGSRFIADGLGNGKIQRSLFTVDPGPHHPRRKDPLAPSKNGQIQPSPFETFEGVSIQQFEIGNASLPDLKKKPPAGPSWVGPAPDAFLDHAVWEGKMKPAARLWRRTSSQCSPKSWLAIGPIEGGWEEVSPGHQRFVLDPARFYARVRQNGVYLVTGQLERESVTSPNPEVGWMRGAWNLEPQDAEKAAANPPAMFPTLNLSEVARFLEGALASAAERKGGGVTGFSVLIKVNR